MAERFEVFLWEHQRFGVLGWDAQGKVGTLGIRGGLIAGFGDLGRDAKGGSRGGGFVVFLEEHHRFGVPGRDCQGGVRDCDDF